MKLCATMDDGHHLLRSTMAKEKRRLPAHFTTAVQQAFQMIIYDHLFVPPPITATALSLPVLLRTDLSYLHNLLYLPLSSHPSYASDTLGTSLHCVAPEVRFIFRAWT